MIKFVLNDQNIDTDLPPGTTVLDLVRYDQDLKGTKIGCREGDCGACTVMVGELVDGAVRYRTMTSCLMPLANAAGKHIVTVEGINPPDGGMTPVQKAMVDASGTQCGFCTVGFVMSLTGFCVDRVSSPHVSKGAAEAVISTSVSSPHVSKGAAEAAISTSVSSPHVSKGAAEAAISAIDGNICRCTGYKSIERAAEDICRKLSEPPSSAGGLSSAINKRIVPEYFAEIGSRLEAIKVAQSAQDAASNHPLPQVVPTFVGGGTDLYVQRHDAMAEAASAHLFDDGGLRGVRDAGEFIEIGASATVTDLLESPVMNAIFPDLYKHLKLVSSTPIRNMATLAGNFINASPIGDMTVWFLALDAEIALSSPPYEGGVAAASADGVVLSRNLSLKDLYLGYKQLAKQPEEFISAIRFRKPIGDFRFNFEKVCKRTYLDIATVNTAISLTVKTTPGEGWLPPALSEPGAIATGSSTQDIEYTITSAHVTTGGVAPIPLYLRQTSAFLVGKTVSEETIAAANEIVQSEVSPISDVRGTEQYKRLLLRQLLTAHFLELFRIPL